MKKWIKCAAIRAIRTVAQVFASMLVIGQTGIADIDWIYILSVSLVAGIASLATSVAGLPELKK